MDSTSAEQKPGFALRFIRWLFSWRTIRRGLIALVALITLAAAVVTEENWRGRRAWENYKSEWEAKGERFDLASIAPKPVPDDQNFFMAPIWDGARNKRWDSTTGEVKQHDPSVVDRLPMQVYVTRDGLDAPTDHGWETRSATDLKAWQDYYRRAAALTNLFPVPPQPRSPAEDVLLALSVNDSGIEELRQASRRPFAEFTADYETILFNPEIQLFAELKACFQVLRLRTIAEVQAGRADQASSDIELMLYLQNSLRTQPLFVSQLVRIACASMAIQPVWEGLARHEWSDGQLAELGEALSKQDFLADYQFAMRGERAFGNAMMEQYRSGRIPGPDGSVVQTPTGFLMRGYLYQSQVVINQTYQKFTFPVVDPEARRVHVEMCGTNALATALKGQSYTVFARMLFPAFQKAAQRFARMQTSMDMAAIGCALERYRLAHGEYPATLDALAPTFMNKVPQDVITGSPLLYHKTDDGLFVLYSVGWNEKDDGGTVAKRKNGLLDVEQGDWVWAYPAK